MPTLVALTTAYVIVFVIALFGNMLVIYMVVSRPHMRTSVNNLLANMAAADLFVALFIIPDAVKFLYVRTKWFGGMTGEILCKAINFFYAVSIAASILTLIFVTIDQFFAVLFPFKRLKLIRNCKAITVLIWSCSLVLMTPHAVAFKVRKNTYGTYLCHYNWSPLANTLSAGKIHLLLIFLLLYQLPLLLIAIMYFFIARKLYFRKIPGNSNEANRRMAETAKRRVVRMLVIVIAVFAGCWLPVHVFHLLVAFYANLSVPLRVAVLLLFVSHMNSAINPFLYLALNTSFRKEFLGICRLRCKIKCCRMHRSRSDYQLRENTESRLTVFKSYNMTDEIQIRQLDKAAVLMTHFGEYTNPVNVTNDD